MQKLFFLFSFFLLTVITKAQPVGLDSTVKKKSSIIADSASLQLISDQFIFTEGPATDKNGDVYFTDQPNNKMWKYTTHGKLSVFSDKAGRSNGMYFDRKRNLVSCADERNQLWSIKPNGDVEVLLKDLNGVHFNGPNDLWISPGGGIYFTDPYYQRDYWTRTSPEMPARNVYYLQDTKKPVTVAGDLEQPNGIIGTPDGKYLYVADIKANKTYRYTINKDGMLTGKKLFVEQGSDGMTIDDQGNVYLTGKGVTVYDTSGLTIEHIDVPQEWTGNITFMGKEKNVLFITASKGIYTLAMKVKGR